MPASPAVIGEEVSPWPPALGFSQQLPCTVWLLTERRCELEPSAGLPGQTAGQKEKHKGLGPQLPGLGTGRIPGPRPRSHLEAQDKGCSHKMLLPQRRTNGLCQLISTHSPISSIPPCASSGASFRSQATAVTTQAAGGMWRARGQRRSGGPLF